jgi:hypothetical protein
MRPSIAICAAALASVALGACGAGVKASDLFIVYRTGAVPGARLTLLVNEEGGVNCNGGRTLRISNSQLVAARAITEELEKAASENLSLSPRAGSVLSYYLRDANGTVRFADNSSSQPAALHQLALLVLEVAQRTCHLPR